MATHSSILLLGKSHRQKSLAGNNPWGHKELDKTEHTQTFLAAAAAAAAAAKSLQSCPTLCDLLGEIP